VKGNVKLVRTTVTMSDVARVANVSVSTVSHVLNQTRKVQPETEVAVLAAIEATGYWTDGIAKSLRMGKTESIGLALSAISNPYFGDVVHAIEKNIAGAGFSLLLADTHDDPLREKRAVTDLLSHRVDAMILAPSSDPAAVLELLSKRRVPSVLIDRVPEQTRPGIDAIGVFNEEPTAKLVDHLAGHGHLRIGLITSVPGLTTTSERLDGYLLGLSRNGLIRDESLIKSGFVGLENIVEKAISELLSLPNPPTALVLGNNQVTISTMSALRERGISVPEDLAIAVFDDFPWADIFHPRLTAIAQPVGLLGSKAVELILKRIENPGLPSEHLRLEPHLMVRESCGCIN
jgi:LacI family transcriptional regulator